MLSLERVIHGPDLPRPLRAALVVLSIALAWVTFKLIERPLRLGAHGTAKCIGLILVMAALGGTGFYVYAHDGMPGYGIRAGDRGSFYDYFADIPTNRWQVTFESQFRHECNFFPKVRKIYHLGQDIDPSCYMPDGLHKNILFIWGDSHAQMLNFGLKNNLPKDWQILQIASSGCPASVAIQQVSDGYCRDSNALAVKVLRETKPSVVIIAQKGGHDVATMRTNAEELKSLGVGRIIFMGPVPQWNEELPKKIVRRFWPNTPERTFDGIDRPSMLRNSEVKKHFFQMDGVTFVDLVEFFCNDDGCLTRIGPDKKLDITTWDYGHLTQLTSDYLAKNLLVSAVLSSGVNTR